MNKILKIIFIFSSVFVYSEERITSFISDIVVNKDRSVLVTEHFTVISEFKKIKHGIVRTFPGNYNYYGFLSGARVRFRVISAMCNNQKENVRIENNLSSTKVYVGNKDAVLLPGTHCYTLTYEIPNIVALDGNGYRLYLNITGAEWTLPIDEVVARVHLSDQMNPLLVKTRAYTGYENEQGSMYSYIKEGNILCFKTLSKSYPSQSLTIDLWFPKYFFIESQSGMLSCWFSYFYDYIDLIQLCLIIILFVLLNFLVKRRLQYRSTNNKIVTQSIPTALVGLSPSQVGFIKDLEFSDKLLIADIVSLAIRGYLKIHFYSDYGFTITRTSKQIETENLLAYDLRLLDALFQNADTVKIISLKSKSLSLAVACCKDQLAVLRGVYVQSFKTIWYISWIIWIVSLVLGCYVTMFDLSAQMWVCWVFSFVVVLLSKKLIYTVDGERMMDHIDFFEKYLKSKKVYDVSATYLENVKLYQDYLPYAIALGVDSNWTSIFNKSLQKIEDINDIDGRGCWSNWNRVRTIKFFRHYTRSNRYHSGGRSGSGSGGFGSGGAGKGGGGTGGGGW